jgi:hypothetical protein
MGLAVSSRSALTRLMLKHRIASVVVTPVIQAFAGIHAIKRRGIRLLFLVREAHLCKLQPAPPPLRLTRLGRARDVHRRRTAAAHSRSASEISAAGGTRRRQHLRCGSSSSDGGVRRVNFESARSWRADRWRWTGKEP